MSLPGWNDPTENRMRALEVAVANLRGERNALAALLRKIMDQPDVGIGAQGPLSKTPGRPFLGLAYSTVPLTPAEAAMLKRLATNGGVP